MSNTPLSRDETVAHIIDDAAGLLMPSTMDSTFISPENPTDQDTAALRTLVVMFYEKMLNLSRAYFLQQWGKGNLHFYYAIQSLCRAYRTGHPVNRPLLTQAALRDLGFLGLMRWLEVFGTTRVRITTETPTGNDDKPFRYETFSADLTYHHQRYGQMEAICAISPKRAIVIASPVSFFETNHINPKISRIQSLPLTSN